MKTTHLFGGLLAFFFVSTFSLAADARILSQAGAGLGVEGRRGYLGPANTHTSFVVRADESLVYLVFLWDGSDLEPWVRVEKKGTPITEMDLSKGNRITLKGGGTFTLTVSAQKGSGHWLCVVLGGREWDP